MVDSTLSQYLKFKYLQYTPTRTRSTLVGNYMNNFTVSARILYSLIDELLTQFCAITSHNEAVSSSFHRVSKLAKYQQTQQEVKKLIAVLS